MVYLVSAQTSLFENTKYKSISVAESLVLLNKCNIIQYDSETTGRDAHINKLLSAQFGSKVYNFQIVVDCATIDITHYKEVLENKYIVGQNLKFDLQFLYNYGIIPRKVYDTMIVEQLLYLGWSNDPAKPSFVSMSLANIAKRRLNLYIDKTVRGEIIWRGLDEKVIIYAARDVEFLEDIMYLQVKECRQKECIVGAKLECDFVPVIAYMEWSGIKLDVDKWKLKMQKDIKHLEEAKEALDNFVINNTALQEFVYVDRQGDLFTGFDTKPKCSISWSSSQQVIKVAKILGFDTTIQDKNTGKDKDSVIEKQLKKQKGINDEFLRLYLGQGEEGDNDYFAGHQGAKKVVTSFGQGHLNAVNPNTGRIHTSYKQLGCDTGRMSCGSTQVNTDLAKLKRLPVKLSPTMKKQGMSTCTYPNMQQLPSDEETRACFIADKGNKWVSCDYSAIESRLGADIYHEQAMIDEFLHGSGDIHSLVAWQVFNKECRDLGCTCVADVKSKAPHPRKKAKPIEFSQQFGGSEFAIQNAMGCSLEEALIFKDSYAKGFPGIARFKEEGAKAVRQKGYILLNPITGHKTYWWDWDKWKEEQLSFTEAFWSEYRELHKGTGDDVALKVSRHFKSVSKWTRKALNSVTQGTGAIILKDSQIEVFNWVVDNGYFGKILLTNLTHDEANWEYPEEVTEFPSILKSSMEKVASKYCKSLPIPADAQVGTKWIH